MSRWSWLAAALVAAAAPAVAQTVVQVRGPNDGLGPQIVAHALAGPHALIERGSTPRLVRRDSAFSHTVITIGRTVVVEGAVHGDLIAIGADVYMHPGGSVDGRVVSIGGGVYESMLARTGEVIVFRDFSYAVQPTANGYALTYRRVAVDTAPAIPLPGPGAFGVRVPTYDRMNGLSLRFAPELRLPGRSVAIEPGLTYRSNLGRLDPGLAITIPFDEATFLRARIERTTATNDAWIRSDLINSLDFLLLGDDTRNYYRATQASLDVRHSWRTVASTVEPYIGVRWERARSLDRDSGATGAPWTFFNRGDPDDARRRNPSIDPATIRSAVAGSRFRWSSGPIALDADLEGELGGPTDASPTASDCSQRACRPSSFGQLTFNGRIDFPTFGTQSFGFDAHAVATRSDNTPRQRWAYVGGPGSIPTLELLKRGGDELVFADFRYNVPIDRVALPLVGAPRITIREVLGGAAVGKFPAIAQAVGGRLSASVFYVELLVDPVHHRSAKGFGISLGR